MSLRTILNYGASLACVALIAAPVGAQESPGKRLAGIVAVAVEEYRLGVNDAGAIISQAELDEARLFLQDARDLAARVTGDHATRVQTLVDSLADASTRRVSPADLDALHARLVDALGPDAALDLPTRRIDLAQGSALYRQHCASCHGVTGGGDGPASVGMDPPPPAFSGDLMREVPPALMFRVVSVGVQGTAMAAWAETLSPDERWDVIAYANTLRAGAEAVARGAVAFDARCGSCRGPRGVLSDFAWLSERSDVQLVDMLRDGDPLAGVTALGDMSVSEAHDVIAFLREEGGRQVASARRAIDPVAARRAVLAWLDSSLASFNAGNARDAGDRAFDAYVAFEPLENAVRARNPGLVSRVESDFLAYRGAVTGGDTQAAIAALERIKPAVDEIASIADTSVHGWAAFAQSLVIILREGLEAILIIGAIIALLTRTGNTSRVRGVWLGTALAILASALTVVILQTLLRSLPATPEIIEGITMLVSVVVLFSVSYWILSKVEARRWQEYIRERVGKAMSRGGSLAMAGVAFLVVYREGAETVLFYNALLIGGGSDIIPPVAFGFATGLVLLGIVMWMVKAFGFRLPLRPFFATTGALLYVMAFVFLGNGLRELQEGGVLPITPIENGPLVNVLGVYPTAETLAGQGVLVLLLLVACWISFIAPRLGARDEQRGAVGAQGAPEQTG